jgi:biotin carboxylase
MRVVRSDAELTEAFLRASNEAKSAFGDGRMFIEKWVIAAVRHLLLGTAVCEGPHASCPHRAGQAQHASKVVS